MSTGFSFGAKTTGAPTFGTGSITFGTPATATSQNQPAFGFTPAAGTQPAAPATGFQFGAPTTSTSTPSLFGSSVSNFKPSGFGTPAQSGLFSTPTTSATPAPGFSFGAPTTTPAPNVGLTFGTPAATAAPSTGLFGATTSTGPTLSFGAPTTTPGLFASTTSSGLSGGLFSTPATTAATTGFGFGASSVNASTLGKPATTSATGFGFGTNPPTSSTGLSFGLGGSVSTSAAASTTIAVSTPTVVGLGGQASSQVKTGAAITTQKEVAPKEQPLPNEILQTVEQFKEMVKKQKMYSSDIARCSIRDFKKVEQEIDLLNNTINEVECQLQKNRYLAEKLKYDTAKCLQHVEMAQRTQDTPPGLQYENTAPTRFFLELADEFEKQMQALKLQIDFADKYVKNHKKPEILTPQDLTLGMRRLHETFVALAGRLQSVHSHVESQKEAYLNLRRHVFNDPTNPFEDSNKQIDMNIRNMNASIYAPPKVASGPTPFNHMPFGNPNSFLQQQSQSPYLTTGTSATPTGFGGSLSFGTQVGSQPSNTSLFGSQFGQTTFGGTSTNFQLQKPPSGGYKRGKQ